MGSQLGLHKNELFQLLSNHRRRYALHACKQSELPITLSELAEQIAAWENDKTVSEITSQERRRVYSSLQQTHLPAMEQAGVIEFENHEVELTPRAKELELYMEVVPADSIPWGEYYLGLSAVSAGLFAAVWMGVYPNWIPDLTWGVLVVLAFSLSACVHVWHTRRSRVGEGTSPPEVNRE